MSDLTKILQWSTAHSSTNSGGNAPSQKPVDFDRELIDAVLGKSDAQKIIEAMQFAESKKESLENREIAFDNLELLVEHIDNAKDLGKMGIWPRLLRVMRDPDDDPSMRAFAAWVMATATQNNPAAAKDFAQAGGIDATIEACRTESNIQVRVKQIYCLSNACANSATLAVTALAREALRFVVVPTLSLPPSSSPNGSEDHDRDLGKIRSKCLFMLQKWAFFDEAASVMARDASLVQILEQIATGDNVEERDTATAVLDAIKQSDNAPTKSDTLLL